MIDSTRTGKSIPDALSKTIPIWCAVFNAASVKLRRIEGISENDSFNEFATLRTPSIVSPSEYDQIIVRIDEWAEALAVSLII